VQVIALAGEHPMPLVDLIALAAEDREKLSFFEGVMSHIYFLSDW